MNRYRAIVWITEEEYEALYWQFDVILRRKLPEHLKSILKKVLDSAAKNHVEEIK